MRYEDWDERLQVYIQESLKGVFEYGKHDCCRFVSGAVFAVVGINILGKLNYAEELKMYRTRRRRLANTVSKVLSEYGFDEVKPLLAGRGDVVLCKISGRDLVGTCIGKEIVTVGLNGLVAVSLLEAKRAWRIN